jgi:hypothetical protein
MPIDTQRARQRAEQEVAAIVDAALNVPQLGYQELASRQQARISWTMGALTWTGRNQAMRISCAMPRASFLSVFTVMWP